MKISLRLLSLLSAALLIAGVIFACGSASDEKTNTPGANNAAAAAETTSEGNTKRIYSSEIEAVDYGGYEFHMATNGLNIEYHSALDFEEMTGDALDDAIYERNRRVEDKFNIKMSCVNDSAASKLKNSVISGSNDYDFVYVLCEEVMDLVAGGYLMPINDLGCIDMTKPYWDIGAQETLKITGKMYHGYLDIGFDHYESMATLFFSGELIRDFNLDDPFQLYKDKDWTMDKMFSMMTAVAADLNGDGKFTVKDDRLGFVGREFEYLPMLYSSNEPLVDIINENDEYSMRFNIDSERLISIGTLIDKMLNDKTISALARDDATRSMFKEGRALFYSRLMGDFRNLRDQEDDYGVISYPTFDYAKDRQYVYVQNPFAVIVPISTEDIDRTGIIIESLAADTYDHVLDIYFEKAVIGKGTRDENSADMMRDMITRRAYDISYAYGLRGTSVNAYTNAVKASSYTSIGARFISAFEKKAEKNLEKILEGFDY
ncbi:MAG: hypothetical protein GX897_00410 [Clostridiales bacterium]|nr:hypothetical protein [Clostridiales bacterium]